MTKVFGGFTIFAKKIMINKLRAIEYGIEIVFWILAFFYFLNNSFLRPVQNIGTECVILLMIAVVVYADKYLYTPLFLLRNRYLPYAFCLVFSVMAATVAEFAVVKPDIVAIFAPSLPEKALNDYLTGVFLNLSLRDSAFVCFFFLFHAFFRTTILRLNEHKVISKETDKHVIMLSNKNMALVDVGKIRYAQCGGNKTTLYLKNGQAYKEYVSLSMVEASLPEGKCLRINRDTIVVYENIRSYTSDSVYLQGSEEPLPFYKKHPEKVLAKLLIWDRGKYVESDKEKLPKNCDLAGLELEICDENPTIGGIGAEFLEENSDKSSDCEQLKKVIQYIRLHPGCKISDISTGTGLKFRTVERLVHDLKTDGRICYKGSKRYGGYEAVEMGNEK